MVINGVELNLDLSKYENLEYFRQCLRALEKCINNAKLLPKQESIYYLWESGILFINYLFGEGTDKKIFGTSASFEDVYNALELIHKEAKKQKRHFKGIVINLDFNRNI